MMNINPDSRKSLENFNIALRFIGLVLQVSKNKNLSDDSIFRKFAFS